MSIDGQDTFKGHCGLCLTFDGKDREINQAQVLISYLHAKFEQNWSINGRDTFKGHCGLCLTFDGKDHVINRSQVSISYLHTKFEQNRSMDGRDRAYLVFQGCLAFLRVHRMYIQEVYRSGKLRLSLNNHFLPSELFGAPRIIVKFGQTWFWVNTLLCPLVATFRSKQRLKLSSLNVATSWYTWIFPIFHP